MKSWFSWELDQLVCEKSSGHEWLLGWFLYCWGVIGCNAGQVSDDEAAAGVPEDLDLSSVAERTPPDVPKSRTSDRVGGRGLRRMAPKKHTKEQ